TVNTTVRTFVLTTTGTATTTRTVQWSDQTVFAGVTAATLDGVTVAVEGYLDSSGVLVARKIRNPAVAAGREDADAYAGVDDGSGRSWSRYRSTHR
ncbi:MAG TPA: DUF5666 domain-containing protein, partial [Rhodocyclaceae bacterium]|nr:DUF5666 domain-containing protein [Rhodocyclaceae bacterium]